MPDALIAPNFLFRFAVPIRYCEAIGKSANLPWTDDHLLPCLRAVEGRLPYGRVYAAWHESGIAFAVDVTGKKQPVWCRDSRLEDSDGIQVWIDTRATHNIHRASRFCHRFGLLPAGGGPRSDQPMPVQLAIARAKESPRPAPAGSIRMTCRPRADGYRLEAVLTTSALTGFDPVEHPRIGFTYALVDRELGWQTFQYGPEYPFMEDPSLWGTLELSRT